MIASLVDREVLSRTPMLSIASDLVSFGGLFDVNKVKDPVAPQGCRQQQNGKRDQFGSVAVASGTQGHGI